MARHLRCVHGMYQLVACAPKGRLLFRTHVEARALWACIISAFPEAIGLVLIPNGVHLDLPAADRVDRLTDAMRGYAVWRNHYRGESGQVWQVHPKTSESTDGGRLRGLRQFTSLNLVRAGLVGDALEWPWSLYREQVGFGFTPGFRPDSSLPSLHEMASRGVGTKSEGTCLPRGTLNAVNVGEVIAAVCGVTRSFADEILSRGRPRTLTLQTAWASYYCDVGKLAEAVGCSPRAVRNAVAAVPSCGRVFGDAELAACVSAVGDTRFYPLFRGDLRTTPEWQQTAYAGMS